MAVEDSDDWQALDARLAERIAELLGNNSNLHAALGRALAQASQLPERNRLIAAVEQVLSGLAGQLQQQGAATVAIAAQTEELRGISASLAQLLGESRRSPPPPTAAELRAAFAAALEDGLKAQLKPPSDYAEAIGTAVAAALADKGKADVEAIAAALAKAIPAKRYGVNSVNSTGQTDTDTTKADTQDDVIEQKSDALIARTKPAFAGRPLWWWPAIAGSGALVVGTLVGLLVAPVLWPPSQPADKPAPAAANAAAPAPPAMTVPDPHKGCLVREQAWIRLVADRSTRPALCTAAERCAISDPTVRSRLGALPPEAQLPIATAMKRDPHLASDERPLEKLLGCFEP